MLLFLQRLWLNRRLRVLSVDLARERDILGDLSEAWATSPCNSDIQYALIDQRALIKDMEEERLALTTQLAELSPA